MHIQLLLQLKIEQGIQPKEEPQEATTLQAQPNNPVPLDESAAGQVPENSKMQLGHTLWKPSCSFHGRHEFRTWSSGIREGILRRQCLQEDIDETNSAAH